ncbi:maturase [Actinoplanes sp. NBRC 14428]|uniref:Group II intron reverse transcriptase/maturase n=1 Tax=Pseudosporangium ferrugineum TaxID=439699 RepID=A0A2T0R279_9ACTN|nr:reverse transcriptase/maturase family protein [Pseudosporangium ferrugineum]PRY13631.1 group II intron reverse transcriptase/maturase [Pseudosporangium ferrugineum]BCJ53029.1 maturase [Actinoplanes sp. NBRC 14428]BCJ55408.1 maturase [Actinoplanes sp. NBRC 14428]
MQSADTVLKVLRDRGRRKLPLERLYRQLFNEQLLLIAYGRIYANDGAMTPGVDGKTPDGMSLEAIRDIIDRLRAERYRFTPVRRIYIPKKNGTRRPLGLPSWTDKLVGEVVRLLLEAYYEPQFSARSHGFRTGRGCHTALDEIAATWTGTTWFIEGDIADCFGSLDHEVMIAILAEHIHDNRFLNLVGGMLRAGYLEDWKWHATHSGAPQGGVISPILSNIYLDRLDTFVEKELVPAWTRGTVRQPNRAYYNATARVGYWKMKGDRVKVAAFRRIQQSMPTRDVHDPDYRRLRYVRYADDHLLGFAGTKAEAEQIKNELATFLRKELKLDLSTEKTLITHARTHKARFLGYDIWTRQVDNWHTKGKRSLNGSIALGVPPETVNSRCRKYLRKQNKPLIRNDLIRTSDHNIVASFGAEYRGYVQYYQMAGNISWLNKLRYVMERSMMSTLAAKYRRSPWVMRRRYESTVDTPYGKRRCFEATQRTPNGTVFTARFGGIPLRRRKHARLIDGAWPTRRGTQLIARLTAGICELCDAHDGITVHHVKRLADLNRYSPAATPSWVQTMRDSRRKTLIVCARCHGDIHQQPHTQ